MHRAVDLALATACGGKARGLAQLVTAGVPVPPGFALTPQAFVDVVGAVPATVALADLGATLAALAARARTCTPPPALADAVRTRAAALGARVIVRSSMPVEDGAASAGPGVGVSRVVAAAEVWDAIRAVWAASLAPLVAAYARARDLAVAAPGVIVQAFVPGYRATVYTRPPGHPADDACWIACGPGAPVRTPRAGPAWRATIELALAAERALGIAAGVDVELVWSFAARAWQVVQARPLIHPLPVVTRAPPPPLVLAGLRATGRPWRRDVTHNPAPLSVAQAELCARVDAAGIAPFSLAVVAHHLYWAARPDAPAVVVPSAPALAAQLAEREHAVASLLARPARDLADALTIYLAAYQILAGELGPLIAAARAVLPDALAGRGRPRAEAAALAPARPSSIAALVAACARGELTRTALVARIGDAAPGWDVALPTFGETPGVIDAALVRAQARPSPPPPPPVPADLAEAVRIGRIAADASERDDLLYWRAQAVVRRALLAMGRARRLAPDDEFWLPLDRLLDDTPLPPALAHGHAGAARAAAARAGSWAWPLSLDDAPATPPVFVGAGVGAAATGPVHHTDGSAPVPPGAIAVARAVTPALALTLDGAVAIVSEHGTPLDHGAAMARELGIPCVVGCPGIYDALAADQWVTVDGDAGTVVPVASRP